MFGKILTLLALQRSSSSNNLLLQQLLAGAGTVIFFSLITAFLASILIAGAVCLAFNLLVANGLSAQAAMMTLGIILLFIMVGVGFAAAHYARRIKSISRQIMFIEHPVAARAQTLVEAFIEGFRRSRFS